MADDWNKGDRSTMKNQNNCGALKLNRRIYRDGLDSGERARYDEKLKLINGQDPYEMRSWSSDPSMLPSVTYVDIINSLLFTPSPYTKEELRCYKGLDAYNQFVNGWVRDAVSNIIGDRCVTTAKVLHSQRLNEKLLRPWVIADTDGKILAAHCTCMAGLGETCTHVASLLFYIEACVKIRDSQTVTQQKAYWKMPKTFRHVSYQKLKDLDFTSASTMKRKFDESISGNEQATPDVKRATKAVIPTPCPERLNNFFTSLSRAPSRPAVLSVVPEFCDKYTPATLHTQLPPVLTDLRNEKAYEQSYEEVRKLCENITIEVSEEQSKKVEIMTRQQSHCSMWYRQRAGRLTASIMKSVCKSNMDMPSGRLVQQICYPEGHKFENAATKWGTNYESTAVDQLKHELMNKHDNLSIRKSGFVISCQYPYLGASPDGVVSCDCCGMSVVEVKCPFKYKNSSLQEINDNKFYLQRNTNGKLCLDRNHQYYWQVQTQLGVCQSERAYFVVWTVKDLHIEEVLFDAVAWETIVKKSKALFEMAVLPELVGKVFSRTATGSAGTEPTDSAAAERDRLQDITNQMQSTWCHCKEEEHGDMICCDNSDCEVQWFHYDCVGVKKEPKGKWFCPDWRKLEKFKKLIKRKGNF